MSTDGKLNATLPRDSDPAAVTMDEAVALLEAREARGPGKPKRGAKKSAAPKQAAPETKPSRRRNRPLPGNGAEKPKRKVKVKAPT